MRLSVATTLFAKPMALADAIADLLLQMVEPHLGLLDQELARLALLVGPDVEITGASTEASADTPTA